MIFRQLRSFGLVEVLVFAAVVFVSFLFLVGNGALSWGPPSGWRRHAGAHLELDHRPDRRPPTAPAAEPPRPPRRRPRPRRLSGEEAAMGLEDLQHNFLTGRLEDLVKWAATYSMWPATFGLACCAIEMMSVGAADFDLARFGMEVFRASPRQADLMIVAGRVSQKMAPVLRQVYDQMMEPKWVLSMGVCASTGGMFNNYAIVQGVDQIVPGGRLRPGCPPTPETLMHAILTLHEKVRTDDITRRAAVDRRRPRPRPRTRVATPTTPGPADGTTGLEPGPPRRRPPRDPQAQSGHRPQRG